MKITLRRLWMENFQGCGCRDLEFGKVTIISGRNATGKTTVANAFSWLLFGKDCAGRANFSLKPLNSDGSPKHNLDTTVEALLDVGGVALRLKKTFREVYKRKRGEAHPEFSGHETDHFLDGVPVKEAEFQGKIREIARDEETFRAITNVRHFAEGMKWQDRRTVLLALAGVTDEQVLATLPDRARVTAALAGRTPENALKVLKATRTEINRELATLPARIDEINRTPVPEGDPATVEASLASSRKLREEYLRELADLRATGPDASGAIAEARSKVAEASDQIARAQADAAKRSIAESNLTHRMDSLEAERKALREEWHKVDASDAPNCPTCGQPLPEGLRSEARTKKEGRLSEVTAKGKACSNELAELFEKRKAERLAREALEAEISRLIKGREALEAAHAKIVAGLGRNAGVSDKAGQIAEIEHVLSVLAEQIADDERRLADMRSAAGLKKRIADLEEKEKSLAREFEENEAAIATVEGFVRAKVRVVTDRVNSMFRRVTFKLFEEQINGGIAECCEVVAGGVPWASLNNGERVNAGIDICSTICAHYGTKAPIWVDNAESVNTLADTRGAQLIALYVNDEDFKITQED